MIEGFEEFKDLNNNLAVPEYQRFCRENGLPFLHSELDPDLRITAAKETLDLFNRMKPEWVYFKDRIVWYQFRTWAGDFASRSWGIDEFLHTANDEIRYFRTLEKMFYVALGLLSVMSAILSMVTIKLISNSLSLSDHWPTICNYASYLFAIIGGALPVLILAPKRKQARERHRLNKRLAKLRERLQDCQRSVEQESGDGV